MILLSFVIGSGLAFLAFMLVCVVKAGTSKCECDLRIPFGEESSQRVAELEAQLEIANKLNANLRGKNAALEHHSKTLDHELSMLGHRFTVTHPHGDPYREVQGQR